MEEGGCGRCLEESARPFRPRTAEISVALSYPMVRLNQWLHVHYSYAILIWMYVYHLGKHICCGYEDGGMRVWNLRECNTTAAMSSTHSGPVNCLAAHPDGTLVITGSEDSTARLVSTSTGKVRSLWGHVVSFPIIYWQVLQ